MTTEGVNIQPQGCLHGILIVGGSILLTIILCLLFPSCKSQVALTNTTEKERIVTEVVRDTVVKTEADSATILALLECDSLNNVILRQLDTKSGERIEPQVSVKQHEDGTLGIQFDCKEDSLRHEIQLRDKIIEEKTTHTEQVAVKYVPDYYKNCTRGFWVLLVILVLIIGWKVAKIYFKIQSGGIL